MDVWRTYGGRLVDVWWTARPGPAGNCQVLTSCCASGTAQLPTAPTALPCTQPVCKVHNGLGFKGDRPPCMSAWVQGRQAPLHEWQLLLAELSKTHEAAQRVFNRQKVQHDIIDLTD